MNVNPISNNSNFGAKFSLDLESKVIAMGKYFQRSNRLAEYEELRESAQVIKKMFPEGTLRVKPCCKYEAIKDKSGNELFRMPIPRADIFLERYGEADVSLIKNGLISTNFKLELDHIKEIARKLKRYQHYLTHKVFADEKKERMLTEKVSFDLL